MSFRSRAALAALALVVVAAPTIAFAGPTPPTPPVAPAFHALDFEIVDVGADKKSSTTRFSVVVAEGWGTTHLGSFVAPYGYDIVAHCDPSVGGKLPLILEVHRRDTRPLGPGDVSLLSNAVVTPSTRVAIGTITRADGGSTEISVRAQ